MVKQHDRISYYRCTHCHQQFSTLLSRRFLWCIHCGGIARHTDRTILLWRRHAPKYA